jgi:hypothetical protein
MVGRGTKGAQPSYIPTMEALMMRPLLPMLLCLPLLGADVSAALGPTLPPIKGITKISTAPVWVAYGTKSVLHNLPGATVTVEDSLPEILPHDLSFRPLFKGSVRLRGGDRSNDPHLVPAPEWMNPTVTMAGPNVVQRSYGFGGVAF